MKSCAFTGHRPQNLPFGFREDDERCTALKETLKKQIISLITDENVTHSSVRHRMCFSRFTA